jgi:hypothetical protein
MRSQSETENPVEFPVLEHGEILKGLIWQDFL